MGRCVVVGHQCARVPRARQNRFTVCICFACHRSPEYAPETGEVVCANKILSQRFFIVAITGILLAMAVVVDAAGEADGEPDLGQRNCGLCEWIIRTPPDRKDYDTRQGIRWSSDADVQDFDRNTRYFDTYGITTRKDLVLSIGSTEE